MPSLAGPHFLHFQIPPPDWLAEVGHLSASCASFLWNGLSHDTRRVYSSARTSYENFCANIMDAVPWPADENVLAEWLSLRARGSTTERALKPDILQSYLSALRSVHVDRRLPIESEWLSLPIGPTSTQRTSIQPCTPQLYLQVTTHSFQSSKSEFVVLVSFTPGHHTRVMVSAAHQASCFNKKPSTRSATTSALFLTGQSPSLSRRDL
jgi:hypothetical protein